MRTFDLSPLLRNTVGFDRFDRLFDTAFNAADGQSFPAYDIVRHDDDKYRITLAVAGYSAEELEINQEGRALTITGKADEEVAASHEGRSKPPPSCIVASPAAPSRAASTWPTR